MLKLFRALRAFALVLPALAMTVTPALEAATAKGKKPVAARKAPARAAAAPAPMCDPSAPWLYRCSDIPIDPEWQFGELPNGVRYVVRKNGVPPGQVSIRIRMDVGSMYEKDSERGFSHLLEHMVFRQSKYLGEGEAIPTWQKMGASFGSDTNAETSPIATTFKLDLPNATEASVDESMKLLSGMMIAPVLNEKNVRTDVPIVLAEMRERGGTATRVFDQTQQTLFAGQKLAVRPVIGTESTLTGATSASVTAFHQRWYRPENAVVIVVGDISPAAMEASIKKWFADWQGVGPRSPEPPFGDPLPPKGAAGLAPIGETRVIVEPEMPRSITYAILRPWRPVRDTVVYNQGIMVESLAQAIINRRLEAKARAGGSFLVAQVNKEKVVRSADTTFVAITPLGPDWKAALRDTRGVIADAMAKPPTQEEIDREVKEFSVAFESGVEQRRLLPGRKLADDMVSALDIRETIASPEVVQDIFNRSKPLFTPANVLAKTRAIFGGSVTRAVYVTPAAGESTPATLRAALAAPVAGNAGSRLAATSIQYSDLPAIGKPSEPIDRKPTGLLDIEQLDYANGVKVQFWPTEDEPGRVTLKVRFGAGWRAFSPGNAPYATLGKTALVDAGVGPFDREAMDRAATGRKIGFDFEIDDATFVFKADTRAADLEDQLHLFASKFANPRWDGNPVLRAQAAAKINYESFAASPQGVLERDLKFLERGRDPVFRTPTPAEIDATTVEGFRKVWEPLLKQGPIEVQLFGDFDKTKAIAALNRTFGALPVRGDLPAGTAGLDTRTLGPSTDPVLLYHRGDANQAAGIIGWPTGGGTAQIRESRQLEILSQLFQNRLLDKLREKLGEAYSPQVVNSWPTELTSGGNVFAIANLQPKSVPVFFTTAEEIAADLAAKPVSAEELGRVTEPLKQALTRATSSSAFFMYLIEGGTNDPARYRSVRSLLGDYTETTPEAMQALAKKFLAPGKSWRVAVIPQGQTLAKMPVPASISAPAAAGR
ncbi:MULTISPECIES: M16 family metallopeptidase [unclassified Novosphingobium]|uniref:M16 family metallopeptidase n=1 Tax=unclassified Novosphingobium TaxID=2644732 RepID=UPI0025DBC333|nr:MULTISPECIES: M16 family metallopeptidase [unclassified Novosphingobium]HQV04878.1 insulinase family protein [Novosphingobium sp.]